MRVFLFLWIVGINLILLLIALLLFCLMVLRFQKTLTYTLVMQRRQDGDSQPTRREEGPSRTGAE
jgi:hypothetical protein